MFYRAQVKAQVTVRLRVSLLLGNSEHKIEEKYSKKETSVNLARIVNKDFLKMGKNSRNWQKERHQIRLRNRSEYNHNNRQCK